MATNKWVLDPQHSEIYFKVKHLMISTITGRFKIFSLTATANDDFTNATEIIFTANTNSVDTNNTDRDAHLKSADFFNSAIYAQLQFIGTAFKKVEEAITLSGNLTICGITQPITVAIEFGGIVVDPYNQTKAGFTLSGVLSRKQFGLTWGAITEAGNVLVSDEVKFYGDMQLVKE